MSVDGHNCTVVNVMARLHPASSPNQFHTISRNGHVSRNRVCPMHCSSEVFCVFV
jgi:hypothetical protein